MASSHITEYDIMTFEEAFERFQEASEQFGHIDPVKIYYYKGNFILTYTKYENNDD